MSTALDTNTTYAGYAPDLLNVGQPPLKPYNHNLSHYHGHNYDSPGKTIVRNPSATPVDSSLRHPNAMYPGTPAYNANRSPLEHDVRHNQRIAEQYRLAQAQQMFRRNAGTRSPP